MWEASHGVIPGGPLKPRFGAPQRLGSRASAPDTELVPSWLKPNTELVSSEQRSRLPGTELVPGELMPNTELVSSKLLSSMGPK